jgi:hypothetical protein
MLASAIRQLPQTTALSIGLVTANLAMGGAAIDHTAASLTIAGVTRVAHIPAG